jgi:5-methyltetrahydrofolate--homocysteine methyltransferase
VTVETTGTMLLGTEIGAALTALEPLGIDVIGLNCATGPAEMSEHLRHLSRTPTVGVSCMPNAGLPVLTADGAHYPLTPGSWPTRTSTSRRLRPRRWSAAAAAPPPSTCGRGRPGGGREVRPREPVRARAASSLYSPRAVPSGRQLPVHR